MRTLLIAATLSFCQLASWNAQAATLIPTADSYVQQSSATTNFGTSTTLRVKRDDSSVNQRKAYIRFDRSSLVGTIDSATLNLDFVPSGLGGGGTTVNWTFAVYGLTDGDAGENWGENTITWNNAPASNTASGYLMLANAELLGTFNLLGQTGSIAFTSPDLIDFLNDDMDDLVSFIVVRNTNQPSSTDDYVHTIAARDFATASARPTLDLTLAAVPEPASIAIWSLIGLGLCGYGCFRARRKK